MHCRLLFLIAVASLLVGSLPASSQDQRMERLGGLPPQPWPQPYHDAQRTSRSPIVGPQSPTVKYVYDVPPPSGFFYFTDYTDITVARSGRAYSQIQHCFSEPQEGCRGYYDTIHPLRPDSAGRPFPLTIEYDAPVVGPDGTLYAHSDTSGGLTALTPFGRVKWTYPGAGTPTLGPDGTIYAYAGPDLIALDSAGALKWSTPLPDNPFTELAIGPAGDFYYGSTDSYLTALTPTGALKWRFPTDSQMHSPPSIAADGSIYAGGRDLYALSPDGSLQWTYTSPWTYFSGTTPALGADGTLHVSTFESVVALNADGTEKWSYPRREVGERIIVGGDGTLYTSWSASVYDTGVLALTETGQLKWTFPLTYPEGVSFHLPLSLGPDGTLYFATGDHVYALGTAP